MPILAFSIKSTLRKTKKASNTLCSISAESFSDFSAASNLLTKAKENGFCNAKIVVYEKGKRLRE